MKYNINYGHKVAAFPESALEVLSRASETDLRLLLCLCAGGGSVDMKRLTRSVGCSESELRESLSFWRGAGVISLPEVQEPTAVEDAVKEEPRTAEKPVEKPERKLKSADELPHYTSEELATILEARSDTATLIDECQNIMGKVFNLHEINKLLGLVDYLGLDCEYILMLLTYCVENGKKTMHYVEKTAFGLYDEGVNTAPALAEELKRREAAANVEGRIRTLFGLGARAFTTKERKFIAAWVGEMSYPYEIIERAYEVSADATGKATLPYTNAVLERWNAAGLRTLEAIEESYKSGEGKPREGSFGTDSFFAAAVSRSLGGDEESQKE